MRSGTYVDDLTLKADVFYDALYDVVIRLRGRRSLAAVVHEELGAALPPGRCHASISAKGIKIDVLNCFPFSPELLKDIGNFLFRKTKADLLHVNCIYRCSYVINFPDSPLMRRMLNFWRPAWHPLTYPMYFFSHGLKGCFIWNWNIVTIGFLSSVLIHSVTRCFKSHITSVFYAKN